MNLVELVVALSILVTLLSVSATMMVRHTRLMTSQRNARIALDELSNQIELLTGLNPDEAEAKIAGLELSRFAADRLSDPKLTGQLSPPTEDGVPQRLTLQLVWGPERQRGRPLELSTWLVPSADVKGLEPESSEQLEEETADAEGTP